MLKEMLEKGLRKGPAGFAVKVYSRKRLKFLENFKKEKPEEYIPPKSLERTLWGIKFRSPIMNAAGMFKNGECYEIVAKQGAGAYLGGTTTANPREGNTENGVHLPWIPYRESGAASNKLGLPNLGDKVVAEKISKLERINGCPIGMSVMASPDLREDKLERLVAGMDRYEKIGVDWLEVNYGCPNTKKGVFDFQKIYDEMRYIKESFLESRSLANRTRVIPVVNKFSANITIKEAEDLTAACIDLGYDGINILNTGTDYNKYRKQIHPSDLKLFDYFTNIHGGGLSGRPLKDPSLFISSVAVMQKEKRKPKQEFHVFRTGGIENAEDLLISERSGISMNQWFTGYWDKYNEKFSERHDIYKKLYEELIKLKRAA